MRAAVHAPALGRAGPNRLAQGLLGVFEPRHVGPAHVGLLRQDRPLPDGRSVSACALGRPAAEVAQRGHRHNGEQQVK